MRLWSIHPKYLDTKGLLALWRESLLAKKVLQNKTKGYKNHPQLIRFKKHKSPILAINNYLAQIYTQAVKRKYKFDNTKFQYTKSISKIPVTSGQIKFEFNHLLNKLKSRDIKKYNQIKNTKNIQINPIFIKVKGDIESWEK